MTYRGVAKGKTIEFEETLPFPEGQTVRVDIERESDDLPRGSPALILKVMMEPPHLDKADIDELERVIAEGRLPVQDKGIFDDDE